MKIRALTLTNVRRFAGRRAAIRGLSDGITVIAAPNEQGKSTFFDALHAVFFQKHTGTPEEVRALRPLSGGNPEVAVEVETARGRFLIEKRWLGAKFARVTDLATGQLVAQADQAEAWLGNLVLSDGGPSGLLWVRQGSFALQPDRKADQEPLLRARRDLLSSVAGEVEAMTGGRRMDAILARAQAELDALVTATGRPATGGVWKRVRDDRAEAEALLADLSAKCDRLRSALEERSLALRDLARLQEPGEVALRQTRLANASAALQRAEARAREVAAAETALKLAEAQERQAIAALAQQVQAEERRIAATEALARDEAAARAAEDHHRAAAAAEAEHEAALHAAEQAVEAQAAAVQAARRAADRQADRDRLAALTATLTQAETARSDAERAAAEAAAIRVDAGTVDLADRLQRRLDLAQAGRDATAARVTIRYAPGATGRFLADGAALADGAGMVLRGRVVIAAEGLGSLTFDESGAAASDAAVEEAARALADHLAAFAVAAPEDLRQALARRRAAEDRARAARDRLAALAPAGLDPLRAEAARLAASAGPDADTGPPPDLAALEAAAAAAADTLRLARARRAGPRERAVAARDASVTAQAALLTARRDRDAAEAAAGPAADRALRHAALSAEVATAGASVGQAEGRLAALAAGTADLDALRADFTRARTAVEAATTRIQQFQVRLAELGTRIAAQAEDDVEERRAEMAGRVEALARRDALYEAEVRALQRLRAALETARAAARDRYFEPVTRELGPLLRMLYDDGEVVMDDATLLPRALIRNGVEEDFGILSGGTREQIAVLTRLAFARLLAQTGESVPVVLDDALVFSDDDRIERMFSALHRAAQGQQIIVFTCRQRAFAALGGDWPEIEVTPV